MSRLTSTSPVASRESIFENGHGDRVDDMAEARRRKSTGLGCAEIQVQFRSRSSPPSSKTYIKPLGSIMSNGLPKVQVSRVFSSSDWLISYQK